MSRHAANASHVYVIDAGDLCKVGTTSRVAKRVTQVVTAYGSLIKRPMRLAAAWETPQAGDVERIVRREYWDNFRNFSNDWFYADAAQMRSDVELAIARMGVDPVSCRRDFGDLPRDRTPCTDPIYMAAVIKEKIRKGWTPRQVKEHYKLKSISTVYRYFDATAVATLQEEGRAKRRRSK